MVGLVRVVSNSAMVAEEAKQAALQRQAAPLLLGLAAHLRRLWDPAQEAKKPIEDKMLRALRQRNGEYEADKLAQIRKQGGSEVYMMITETKCRAAESWLRDILLDSGKIPFDVDPTPLPDLPPDEVARVNEHYAQRVIQTIEQTGAAPEGEFMRELEEQAKDDALRELMEEAKETADRMARKMLDQFVEGGLINGFDDFLTDLTTYPLAWLKGPVVRRQRRLKWQKGPDGQFAPLPSEELIPTFTRVDPFRMYPEPGVTNLCEGYVFEHHRLTRSDLSDLIGLPGYDDEAIRAILAEMPMGSMGNWMWSAENTKAPLEGKFATWMRPTEIVDALEFYGKIPGSLLLEWGMSPEEIPDPAKEYDCNAWLIDRWVIKATLNYDPLGDKPYRCTSFFKKPGALYGSAIPDTIEDIQQMCNAAARALNNNMGLASGPQVEINIDRLPPDEKITSMYPWKIWQTTNDPMGGGQPAIHFTQPDDRSQPLMMVYQHFAKLADDQSGIPAYIYGDMQVGGAGRTASGLSMLMGSAGKGIRQVIMHIDADIIAPLGAAQYSWNMRYVDDPSIKGDAQVVPRGAVVLANREQLNVRRIEFLNATANEFDMEIIGKPGRAAILREVSKELAMPAEEIVPSKDKLEIQDKLQQAMMAQQAAAPQASVQFQRDEQGQVQGANVFPGGQKMGGQEANTVSSRTSGRAA